MNYKTILQWLLNFADKNITQDIIDNGLSLITNEFKQDLINKNKHIRKIFNKKYHSFLKNDFAKRHKNINVFSKSDINAKFRQILEKRILHSLNAIKIKDERLLLELQQRFINFISDDKEKTMHNLQENLKANEMLKHSKNYVRNVLREQTSKMNDDIDYTCGMINGAIGLIWHTQDDIKVVGNPNGLYPKGNELHNNHYKRNNVFFALKDSYATKQKLLNAEIFENLQDIKNIKRAINCRCYYEYIYDLRDVEKQYLTQKGINFINRYL